MATAQTNNNQSVAANNAAEPVVKPKDVKLVANILKSMSVANYEPRVVDQLVEFMHKYVHDVVTDAKIFQNHAKKTSLDVEDLRLSIQQRTNNVFTKPPAREVCFCSISFH